MSYSFSFEIELSRPRVAPKLARYLRVAVCALMPAPLIIAADIKLESDWRTAMSSAVAAVNANNFPKAEQLFQMAVQEADRFEAGDPRRGATINALGLLFKEEKKYADAEKAFGKAIVIMEKAYGAESLDVGNVNYNLATVMMAEGHYEAALPVILRSRAVFDKNLGKQSLKTASALCMAGDAYRSLKKYEDAEGMLKQCADSREAAGGMENAELADALYSLALVYQQLGKYAAADARLKLTAKIREITLGVTSPQFAEALEAHASLLKAMGRDQEAAKDLAMAGAVRRSAKK